MGKWSRTTIGTRVNGIPKPEAYHVLPVGDLKEHDMNPRCHCKPVIQENGMLIVHNAYDGREFFENA